MQRFMVLFIVSTLVISTNASTLTKKEATTKGKNAIQKFGKTLKQNLIKHMKSGGPVKAATFCSLKASSLKASLNKSFKEGVAVKRISLKNRNPNNFPKDELEKRLLQEFEAGSKKNKKYKQLLVREISNKHYKVLKPLYMEGSCIQCHGSAKSRNAKAYRIIKRKYPNDKAIGYKLGDFRGFIVADVRE